VDPLTDPAILFEISRAWRDSAADDPANRHEEGGYIVLKADRSFGVKRWPAGERSGIVPPSLDMNNRYDDKEVVAAFHTHPNPALDEAGREWDQGPSESDRRWHARRKLLGFVIGRVFVYKIGVNATIEVIGRREDVL
jgi:hypothetical protein